MSAAQITEPTNLQSLGDRARAALESVTAQDPEHLKVLSSYFKELEAKYTNLLETIEGDDDQDDDEDDPEALDADIVFNTRDWHKGGIITRFHDAPSAEEGDIAEVEAFPVFYPRDHQPLKDLKWKVKESSRPSKPSTLVVDYGAELEQLKKEPLFRGFKVLVHMVNSDDDDDDEGEDDEDEDDEGEAPN